MTDRKSCADCQRVSR